MDTSTREYEQFNLLCNELNEIDYSIVRNCSRHHGIQTSLFCTVVVFNVKTVPQTVRFEKEEGEIDSAMPDLNRNSSRTSIMASSAGLILTAAPR